MNDLDRIMVNQAYIMRNLVCLIRLLQPVQQTQLSAQDTQSWIDGLLDRANYIEQYAYRNKGPKNQWEMDSRLMPITPVSGSG